MKVLFVASESVPFAKTGGLGDVIGSLPKELQQQGVQVAVMMPKYSDIPTEFTRNMCQKAEIIVPIGWRHQYCGVMALVYQGITFYFIDNEYYFKRSGYYGYADDAERFAFFCRGVLASLPAIDFQPDIIHCHDWHTALISLFLNAHYRWHPFYHKIKSLFTIHNLGYQGIFPKDILGELLNLNVSYFTQDALEFYGELNFMKGGIVFSHAINTVSKTYAEEIQQPYFGEKLDGLLRQRSQVLTGIVNGIDYQHFNPESDELIFANYNKHTLAKKKINKTHLQQLLGLPIKPDVPMVAVISRLVDQKGLDLISHLIHQIMALDLQLVVLGTGDKHYERMFSHLGQQYGQKLSANILYNEQLAHRVYAAADMLLMPSRFEPCGLGQLIAMRYGTIPIVRETGGLKDTVVPYNQYDGTGFGFSFANYNAHEMLFTLQRALSFYEHPHIWSQICAQAMSQDYSWKHSAQLYKQLYQELLYS